MFIVNRAMAVSNFWIALARVCLYTLQSVLSGCCQSPAYPHAHNAWFCQSLIPSYNNESSKIGVMNQSYSWLYKTRMNFCFIPCSPGLRVTLIHDSYFLSSHSNSFCHRRKRVRGTTKSQVPCVGVCRGLTGCCYQYAERGAKLLFARAAAPPPHSANSLHAEKTRCIQSK